MNSIANKFDNVTYTNSKLTVTDNQGNIKYSKDIKTNQPGYTEKTIKNILSNVYNNVMSENNNANAPQTSSEQNASTFYTNKGNTILMILDMLYETLKRSHSHLTHKKHIAKTRWQMYGTIV